MIGYFVCFFSDDTFNFNSVRHIGLDSYHSSLSKDFLQKHKLKPWSIFVLFYIYIKLFNRLIFILSNLIPLCLEIIYSHEFCFYHILQIASGPMLKMCYSMEDYSNGLNVHKRLQNLNIISSDFGGIKNTTKQFFACLTSFLACVLGLNIIVTILTIFPKMFYKKILYAAVVFFSLVCIQHTILNRA